MVFCVQLCKKWSSENDFCLFIQMKDRIHPTYNEKVKELEDKVKELEARRQEEEARRQEEIVELKARLEELEGRRKRKNKRKTTETFVCT